MLQQTAATQAFFMFHLAHWYPSCSGCPCILPAFSSPAVSSPLPFPPPSPAQSSHTALAITLTYKPPSKSVLSSPTRPDNILELALWPFPAMTPLGSPLCFAGALSPHQLCGVILHCTSVPQNFSLGDFPPNPCMRVPAAGLQAHSISSKIALSYHWKILC